MAPSKASTDVLPIGQVAMRVGISVSAIHFYEKSGLITADRTNAGHRRFPRSAIRRLSFILIAQRLGYRLEEIGRQLDTLPTDTAPTNEDWQRLSKQFHIELQERIDGLMQLRDKLDGCIGCGCLSLDKCLIYNHGDAAETLGLGPRFLLGDKPTDLPKSSA